MPNIRPSSDVRNNYQELSKLCKESGMPVYLTVNGKGDTALIDIAVLDSLYARLEVLSDLTRGINDIESGRVKTHEEAFSKFVARE